MVAHDWMASIGFDVETASSADEALSLPAAKEFNVLFTDILMPGSMDGIALARRAKADLLAAVANTARTSLAPA